MQNLRAFKRITGFTLVELLVTLAVIGVLVALLLPAIQYARESARRTQCLNQVRQLGIACHNYHGAHNTLPPGSLESSPFAAPSSGWGWQAMILPQLEQQNLYDQIDFRFRTLEPPNRQLVDFALPVGKCPSAGGQRTAWTNSFGGTEIALGNYAGCQGTLTDEGVLFPNSKISFASITDGTSHTILASEMLNNLESSSLATVHWQGVLTTQHRHFPHSLPTLTVLDDVPINGAPENFAGAYSSRHSGGINVLFCDASARFVSENIDTKIFSSLATRAGNEVGQVP